MDNILTSEVYTPDNFIGLLTGNLSANIKGYNQATQIHDELAKAGIESPENPLRDYDLGEVNEFVADGAQVILVRMHHFEGDTAINEYRWFEVPKDATYIFGTDYTIPKLRGKITRQYKEYLRRQLQLSKEEILKSSYLTNFTTEVYEFLTAEPHKLLDMYYITALSELSDPMMALWSFYTDCAGDLHYDTWTGIAEIIRRFIDEKEKNENVQD